MFSLLILVAKEPEHVLHILWICHQNILLIVHDPSFRYYIYFCLPLEMTFLLIYPFLIKTIGYDKITKNGTKELEHLPKRYSLGLLKMLPQPRLQSDGHFITL